VSLLSSIKSIGSKIADAIGGIVDEFAKIVDVILHIRDYTIGVIEDAQALIQEATTEWDELTHFKFVIAWKTRVISVPRVFDNIQELIALPQKVIDAVKDLITNIRTRFTATEAAEAVEEVIPGIGQAAGIITAICEVLIIIKGTIADVKTIVDAIQTLRKDIEDLDAIFLPNRNPRRLEQLAGGGSIKIRVGKLHPS
jgi:hypothetical protein